jgi:hypothetical protein
LRVSTSFTKDNTNFSRLTTSSGAHWAMSSCLGGFPSKSNKCFTKYDEAQRVLKVWLALNCSLTLNLSTQHFNHTLITHSHKERGQGELKQGLGSVFDVLKISSNSLQQT